MGAHHRLMAAKDFMGACAPGILKIQWRLPKEISEHLMQASDR